MRIVILFFFIASTAVLHSEENIAMPSEPKKNHRLYINTCGLPIVPCVELGYERNIEISEKFAFSLGPMVEIGMSRYTLKDEYAKSSNLRQLAATGSFGIAAIRAIYYRNSFPEGFFVGPVAGIFWIDGNMSDPPCQECTLIQGSTIHSRFKPTAGFELGYSFKANFINASLGIRFLFAEAGLIQYQVSKSNQDYRGSAAIPIYGQPFFATFILSFGYLF